MTFEDPNTFRPQDHFIIQPQRGPRAPWVPQAGDEEAGVIHPRQPNLLYSLSIIAIGFATLLGISTAIAVIALLMHHGLLDAGKSAMSTPKISIALEAATFAITFAIAYVVFPRFWHRPFAAVIRWNGFAARRNIGKLIAAGIVLSMVAQALESLLTLPKEMPVDAFFKHPSDVWIIALFGTFVAPVAEELFFRGFLLRGFAILFDWFALPRTPAGHEMWRSTNTLSRRAVILSGILTSGLFAAMHAAQLGWAWNAVGVLWIVGGALTYIRIRFDSVAASALVHASYNGFLFAVMFVITDGFRHLDKLASH